MLTGGNTRLAHSDVPTPAVVERQRGRGVGRRDGLRPWRTRRREVLPSSSRLWGRRTEAGGNRTHLARSGRRARGGYRHRAPRPARPSVRSFESRAEERVEKSEKEKARTNSSPGTRSVARSPRFPRPPTTASLHSALALRVPPQRKVRRRAPGGTPCPGSCATTCRCWEGGEPRLGRGECTVAVSTAAGRRGCCAADW